MLIIYKALKFRARTFQNASVIFTDAMLETFDEDQWTFISYKNKHPSIIKIHVPFCLSSDIKIVMTLLYMRKCNPSNTTRLEKTIKNREHRTICINLSNRGTVHKEQN